MGYQNSNNDYSLFHKNMGSYVTFVAIYVDDIMVTRNNEEEITKLKTFLDNTFKIKDLGSLNFIWELKFCIIHQVSFSLKESLPHNC